MIDCARAIAELTSYEGYRCFVDSPDWTSIAHHVEQAWSVVAESSLGQWVIAIVMLGVVLPTLALSWLMPFAVVYLLFQLIRTRAQATWGMATEGFASWDQAPSQAAADRTRRRFKNGWAVYMLLGGAAVIILDLSDTQMSLTSLQGGWQLVCGIAIYLVPLPWWSASDAGADEINPLWEIAFDLLQLIASFNS
jgi:hypothetical protein